MAMETIDFRMNMVIFHSCGSLPAGDTLEKTHGERRSLSDFEKAWSFSISMFNCWGVDDLKWGFRRL